MPYTRRDRHGSVRYREALRKVDIERQLERTDEDIEGMEQAEFLDLVEAVLQDLFRMEDAVKKRKDLFDRLRKPRLADLAAEHTGKVLELGDVLLQFGESKPSVPWAKIVKALVAARPELQAMVDELVETEMSSKSPTPKIYKHPRHKEPAKWKKLEHKPLRESAFRREALQALRHPQMNEDAEAEMLQAQIMALDELIAEFRSYL